MDTFFFWLFMANIAIDLIAGEWSGACGFICAAIAQYRIIQYNKLIDNL